MDISKLTFPLTVDFGSDSYWIGDAGPFAYGTAATEFLVCNEFDSNELEKQLQTFGTHLLPYAKEKARDADMFFAPEENAVEYSMCFAHRIDFGAVGAYVERCTFSSLHDFLYVELGKAIAKGNAPRQCRLCGKWFLHTQGNTALYCERIAPNETEKTCREVGARAVFESKIQSDEIWKIYKRAYKKYYARVMKGNMTRDSFDAWAKAAAGQRDTTMLLCEGTSDPAKKAQCIESLREELNRL